MGTVDALWANVWARLLCVGVRQGRGRSEASRGRRERVRTPLPRCCNPSLTCDMGRLSPVTVPVGDHNERTVGLGDAFITVVGGDRRGQLTTDPG
jgi:hypothetical protein